MYEFAASLEVGGFGFLDREAGVAVVEAKQDVALVNVLRVHHRNLDNRRRDERRHLSAIGTHIGVVGRYVAGVMQHVPAAAGEKESGGKA